MFCLLGPRRRGDCGARCRTCKYGVPLEFRTLRGTAAVRRQLMASDERLGVRGRVSYKALPDRTCSIPLGRCGKKPKRQHPHWGRKR